MIKTTYKKLLKQKHVKPITCLTAYTNSMAKILDGIVDVVLIGDSLATVLYGMKNTRTVSLEMIKYHGRAVTKNIKQSLTIIDMPYGTYNNKYQALKNAKNIIKFTKADLIKIETDSKNIGILKYLTKNKIKVVGHIGITPQKFKDFKKIRSVGKTNKEEKSLISLALNLEKAGAKFIILECIKLHVAKKITNILKIPSIGIGSSKYCDGQVLVLNDMLNIDTNEIKPKFVKKYTNINKVVRGAVKKFTKEVKNKKFPSKNFSYL
tara:strand:- start:115 stop:909 length:795 start_codon:yes stop_codon:yes gene_type:complete